MVKSLKVVFLILCVFGTTTRLYGASDVAAGDAVDVNVFDWEPVMEAIIRVESEGDARAVSGNSCGAMQITPIMVAECNDILKKRRSKKRFSLHDRFSVEKSKEMFLLIQSHFNPLNNIEQAIRSWNGGNHYSLKRTQRYFEKVMKCLSVKS